MRVISTNIAQPRTIIWNKKEVTTGIYKEPTNTGLYLQESKVQGDEISDRIHHGGVFKACYIFSIEQYPYWQHHYPSLNWNYGMFGENLTLAEFDEREVYHGDIYKVGEALVEITQYREPCYKLGYKFGSQKILKQFISHGFAGSYLRVLKEGRVENGDTFQLIERPQKSLSVHSLFKLAYEKEKDSELLRIASESHALPKNIRAFFKKQLQ